jgi:Fe-S cluster assembly protein SufD
LFVTTAGEPSTLTTRNVVVLEEGACATIIETHLGGADAYVANSLTEARLGKGSRLDRVKLEAEGPAAIHLANFHADVGEGATLRDFTLTVGGRAVRQQGFVTITGEGADIGVSGAYLLDGRQHADTRLVVDHAVPHGTSRELFKCVMDGNSRGVFQGKVTVRPGAQKSDGKQSSHGLLLSETAEFDAKPELEIYADDVICGHGATSGELDETMLFYLNSRGIPEVEAKSLLIAAFVGEAFDTVNNEAVRDELTRLTGEWLVGRRRP